MKELSKELVTEFIRCTDAETLEAAAEMGYREDVATLLSCVNQEIEKAKERQSWNIVSLLAEKQGRLELIYENIPSLEEVQKGEFLFENIEDAYVTEQGDDLMLCHDDVKMKLKEPREVVDGSVHIMSPVDLETNMAVIPHEYITNENIDIHLPVKQ